MAASPPPTPPSWKADEDEERFKPINSFCEWVERYQPDGYHPVILGDFFNNGQYKVIRKLGNGSFSTVWLAHDLKNSRYVALKILVSALTESTNELRLLRHIANVAPAEGTRHITRLLDKFEHHGPNGIHMCLVFEPMGPCLNAMIEELPEFKTRKFGEHIRYSIPVAKSILKQCLQALEFLHRNGIAHGDFHQGNMLFALNNIDSKPEDMLQQDTDNTKTKSISPPVQRLDGKQDKWAPPYLCLAQSLAPFARYPEGIEIKLTDMGGAYFFTDPPEKPLIPRGLRAPELILTGAFNKTFDIWSFGCLVFELITGWPLVGSWDSAKDDHHLLALTDLLGPLPDELFQHWKTSSLYFTPERKVFNYRLGGVAPGDTPLMVDQISMEKQFDNASPDLDEEEALKVKALIRRILRYDPAERPSPRELLSDPWFSETEAESGSSK